MVDRDRPFPPPLLILVLGTRRLRPPEIHESSLALVRLTRRADVRVVPVDACLADLLPTARARQEVPQPHLQEVADLLIHRRRPPRYLCPCLAEHLDNGVVEPIELLDGEALDDALRMDPGLPEHLVAVGVAHEVEGALVEQEHPDLL